MTPHLRSGQVEKLGLYVRTDGRRLVHSGDPSDRFILSTDLAFDVP